jgi:hypothetical protein
MFKLPQMSILLYNINTVLIIDYNLKEKNILQTKTEYKNKSNKCTNILLTDLDTLAGKIQILVS